MSTFQIRLNNTNYQADAYNTCLNNTFFNCNNYLFSYGKALSKMREWTLHGAKTSSETSNAIERIKIMNQVLESGSLDEKT